MWWQKVQPTLMEIANPTDKVVQAMGPDPRQGIQRHTIGDSAVGDNGYRCAMQSGWKVRF